MFNSDGTISNGHLYIFATADVVTSESAEFGDADRRGWVSDLNGSEVEESRNYVEPLVSMKWPLEDELAQNPDSYVDLSSVTDEIQDVINGLGAYSTEDGSTLYAEDSVDHDPTTDESWHYALHAHVKHVGPNGWVETPVDITSI